MSIPRAVVVLVVLISSVAVTSAAQASQCITINIPAFNLSPDNTCSVSSSALIRRKLPDQVFVASLGVLPSNCCFEVVDPDGTNGVDGMLIDEETGNVLYVTVSGVAGLTLNAYPNSGLGPDGETTSFTAATLVAIHAEGEYLGTLVTRDSGTIFSDGNTTARLTVAASTYKLRHVKGYIDEVGEEFNPYLPARATGKLCARGLVNRLFTSD